MCRYYSKRAKDLISIFGTVVLNLSENGFRDVYQIPRCRLHLRVFGKIDDRSIPEYIHVLRNRCSKHNKSFKVDTFSLSKRVLVTEAIFVYCQFSGQFLVHDNTVTYVYRVSKNKTSFGLPLTAICTGLSVMPYSLKIFAEQLKSVHSLKQGIMLMIYNVVQLRKV